MLIRFYGEQKENMRGWFLTITSCVFVLMSARVEYLHWLSFIWLVPLAFVLHRSSTKRAAISAFVCALLFWCLSISWALKPLISSSGSSIFVGGLVFIIICCWQALPYGFFGLLYSYFEISESKAEPIVAAALMSALLCLWPSPIPGLPLHSLYVYPKFVGIVDLSGISLLVFFSSLFSFYLKNFLKYRGGVQYFILFSLLLIPLFLYFYGVSYNMRYETALKKANESQWLKIAYIQPNLRREDDASALYNMSMNIIEREKPDLLIWPEVPIVYSLINLPDDERQTKQLSKGYDQDILLNSGYVYATDDKIGDYRTYYNRTHLVEHGVIQGEYSKQKLVPFFEYMPKYLEFMRKWMPEVLLYRQGLNQGPIEYKGNVSLSVVLCYEAIFSGLVRSMVRDGVNVLVNPTSDTRFVDSFGPKYHLALSYFRAIENRVPFVRVNNSGISVVVDARGIPIIPPSELNISTTGIASIFLLTERSLYHKYGDWFSFVALLFFCVYVALKKLRVFNS